MSSLFRSLGLVVIVAFANFFVPANAAIRSNRKMVEIRLDSFPEIPEHHATTRITLIQERTGFRCKTDMVPEHRIKVRGLKTLEPPFKESKILPHCQHVLTWGKTKQCYENNASAVLDDLMQWCSNI
jgi:hypothetical protein